MSAVKASTCTIVGSLACQRDSYLKSFTSKVIACQKVTPKGKKAAPESEIYEIELENTILFPEGGGQPGDKGQLIIGGSEVVANVEDVQRKNLRAVHIADKPIEVGTNVTMNLDWRRRLDHMQQHTGQHLLSAVLDRYDLPTLSWSMGEMINYIELPRKLTPEEIHKVSLEVNDAILTDEPIKVEYPDTEIDETEKGVMRIVHIGKLDANPCCGTHLKSTGHIKAIVLLNQFAGKSGASRLNFLCGDRVITYTSGLHELTKKLMTTLSGSLEDLDTKAASIVEQGKKASQKANSLMLELALLKVAEVKKDIQEGKPVTFVYRPDGDLTYINNIYKEVSKELGSTTVVLITGEVKQTGAIIVDGERTSEIVDQLKKLLKTLKGGGKGKFQGKVSEYGKGELEETLAYLRSL